MRRGLILAILVLALCACGKKGGVPAGEPAAGSPGTEPAAARQPGAPAVPAAQPEVGSPESRVTSVCPESKSISSGDQTTPAGTVYLAYKAALKGDTPAAVEEFSALFGDAVNRDHVKRNLWPRLVQFAPKYTASPTDATYTLCRTVQAGDGRIKLFVKSNDPKKSDPPIVLVNEGGAWRIDVFTP